jgi:hypothetical protein
MSQAEESPESYFSFKTDLVTSGKLSNFELLWSIDFRIQPEWL